MADDLIAFDALEIKLFGAVYLIQSDTVISMTNARDFLTYKLELSKIYPLQTLASADSGDLILPGRFNTGVVLAKITSNQVACDLFFSLCPSPEVEVDSVCSILMLESKTRVDDQPIKGFTIKSVMDKNVAIIFKYKFPVIPDNDKRVIGKLIFEGLFVRQVDSIAKKTDVSLCLNSPRSLRLTYKSYCQMYSVEIENQLASQVTLNKIRIAEISIIDNLVLEPHEVFSTFHDNTEKKATVVPFEISYSLDQKFLILNPVLRDQDESSFTKLMREPGHCLESQQKISLDLMNPNTNIGFKVLVSAPPEADLHSSFQVTVDVETLKKQPCLVHLSDRNLENMLIVDKNSVLCDFNRLTESTAKVTFEILPLKTGYLKIPDILVLSVDGRDENTRSTVEVRNAFVKVATQSEVGCVHTNNLFNDKVQEV